MSRSTSVLRPALALLSVRLVLHQIGLALLVFALSAIWLRVPDASAIDVAASVLLAFIVLALAGAGESTLILRLSDQERTPAKLMRGTVFLLIGGAVWIACSTLLKHLQAYDSVRAGYLNSRLPHTLRNIFSYDHILLWLDWLWTLLHSVCIGLIALIAVTSTASSKPVRAIKRSLHSVMYWIAIVVGIPCAIALTHALTQWTPGRGLRIETLSLLLRLTLAILGDATVVCILLAILAACVRQVNSHVIVPNNINQFTPAGTPEESQPRTVDNP